MNTHKSYRDLFHLSPTIRHIWREHGVSSKLIRSFTPTEDINFQKPQYAQIYSLVRVSFLNECAQQLQARSGAGGKRSWVMNTEICPSLCKCLLNLNKQKIKILDWSLEIPGVFKATIHVFKININLCYLKCCCIDPFELQVSEADSVWKVMDFSLKLSKKRAILCVIFKGTGLLKTIKTFHPLHPFCSLPWGICFALWIR